MNVRPSDKQLTQSKGSIRGSNYLYGCDSVADMAPLSITHPQDASAWDSSWERNARSSLPRAVHVTRNWDHSPRGHIPWRADAHVPSLETMTGVVQDTPAANRLPNPAKPSCPLGAPGGRGWLCHKHTFAFIWLSWLCVLLNKFRFGKDYFWYTAA